MEKSCLLWMAFLGSLFIITNSYTSPSLQYDFVPERHPNWNKLDHKNCGFSLRNRIIGGKNAQFGQYPWLVRLGKISNLPNGAVYMTFPCGGAILNRYYVLSAAHCFLQLKHFPNMVRVGEYDLDRNPDCDEDICAPPVQDINVLECYIPRHFNSKFMENDIVLCLLEKPIRFNELVSPICLLPHGISSLNMSNVISEVAGWGVTDINTKNTARILKTVRLDIVENRMCAAYRRKHKHFPANILCAGNKKGMDSCAGDSGGPLMVPLTAEGPRRYYIIGVVSYGPERCGEEPVPAVYTKVAQMQLWILDLITMA